MKINKCTLNQRLRTIAALLIAIAFMATACTPKKSQASLEATQKQIPTKDLIYSENNPIELAKWAFELMMQMEGRDNHDPAVVEALTAIYEKAGQLPEGGYTIFSKEVSRLYHGELLEDEEVDEEVIEVLFELKSPRMHSQDILNLQTHLLSLGFSGVGSADGYYGPMTEGVIKNIQAFSGFESNGKVTGKLWDFLFNESKITFLQNLSNVLTHDPNKHIKSRDLYGDEPGDESAYVYYSLTDNKVRIVEHSIGTAITENFLTYYFVDDTEYGAIVNDAYYFVKSVKTRWDIDSNTRVIDEEDIFLRTYEGIFIVKNGVFEPSDNQGIIGLQITIMEKYFEEENKPLPDYL